MKLPREAREAQEVCREKHARRFEQHRRERVPATESAGIFVLVSGEQ
jgi:hypothetical protein